MPEIDYIEEYPLPFNQEEIVEMQEEAANDVIPLDEDEIEESVDGFHERYIQEMIRTDEWVVFRCHWIGCQGRIYFWNHMAGYGFTVDNSWEFMCAFVDMMEEFTNEFSSEDFEPAHYAWELP